MSTIPYAGAFPVPIVTTVLRIGALLFALLLGCGAVALANPNTVVVGTGAVTGSVTTADGSPITQAVVTLAGNGPDRVLPVGTQGGFIFNGLPSGTYVVRAMARGFDAVSGRTIDVAVGKVTSVDLVMARSSSSLVTIGAVRANGSAAISTSSAPTTTLSAQTYAAQGYTHVSDVLQNDISTTLVHPLGGHSALFTTVALRGPDPSETLVDIDGHQVNTGGTGDFDLSLLDPADYSNVEIVKGISPSSLVGPDTIDGAFNIRTLEPTSSPHALMRLSAGSFNSFGQTFQYTGTQNRFGYALSLHRTTTSGEVNQTVLAAPADTSGEPAAQQIGSAVDASTALGKLRYTFGRGDGYLALSFHDQSVYRDLSAGLSSIPDAENSASGLPLVDSFAGTSLSAHNAGYGFDARFPIGAAGSSGVSATSALVRHYTYLVSQSVFGPGADTSPYLYNDRDLVNDDSVQIDHAFGSGTLSFQYGIRNERLDTDFVAGGVVSDSVVRRPLDEGAQPSQGTDTSRLSLGQTQRTAALRYTGDVSARLHVAAAAYYSNYSSFGSSFDPRLGLTWTPNAQSAIRASVGTTFQVPHLPELVVPPVLPPPVGGVISIGNPNLRPDYATEYSLGYEHVFAAGPHATNASIDLYRANLRGPAATFIPAPAPGCEGSSGGTALGTRGIIPPPRCPLSYPVNAGNAVYQGAEMQLAHQVSPFTTVRAGYAIRSAYLTKVPPDVQNGTLVVGEQSLGLPLHKATLSFDHTPQLGLTYGVGIIWEGAYNELNQPPYAVLNANVAYRLKNYEIGLAARNLTNVYDQRFTRIGAGVPYGGQGRPIPTDAYALQGTSFTLSLTRRF